jgi:hypothetical protein
MEGRESNGKFQDFPSKKLNMKVKRKIMSLVLPIKTTHKFKDGE